MDIKTRIDGLTEAEAKAALEYLVEFIEFNNRFINDSKIDIEYLLDKALKEARK